MIPAALRTPLRALVITCFMLVAGCARMPGTTITPLKSETWADLRDQLLAQKPDVERFRERGPFEVSVLEDMELTLAGPQRVVADLYLAAPPGKAPLAILFHGYGNGKADHAYQALHLATWGIHSLAVQLPNTGPWITHGRTLAKLVDLIHRRPEILDERVDGQKIVLVGHSFGASSVAVALSGGTPALGAVLLDPAAIGRGLPGYLGKIARPVLVLGADRDVIATRGRSNFYRYVRSGIAEISIRGATHEDAEFPLEPAFGMDARTEEHQITFVAALTAGVFSLASTGGLDYAWSGFGSTEKNGRFIDSRKK